MCQLISFKYIEFVRSQRYTTKTSDKIRRDSSTGSTKRPETISVSSGKKWDERLQAYIANNIETDTTPVYGDGFREAAKCCAVLGLDILLQHIKEYKEFPKLS